MRLRPIDRGGDDETIVRRRRSVCAVGDRFVHRAARRALAFQADAAGGVALRVAVDEQHRAARDGERGSEIDGGGGLSDPAFLIGDGDDLGHLRSIDLNTVVSRAAVIRILQSSEVFHVKHESLGLRSCHDPSLTEHYLSLLLERDLTERISGRSKLAVAARTPAEIARRQARERGRIFPPVFRNA